MHGNHENPRTWAAQFLALVPPHCLSTIDWNGMKNCNLFGETMEDCGQSCSCIPGTLPRGLWKPLCLALSFLLQWPFAEMRVVEIGEHKAFWRCAMELAPLLNKPLPTLATIFTDEKQDAKREHREPEHGQIDRSDPAKTLGCHDAVVSLQNVANQPRWIEKVVRRCRLHFLLWPDHQYFEHSWRDECTGVLHNLCRAPCGVPCGVPCGRSRPAHTARPTGHDPHPCADADSGADTGPGGLITASIMGGLGNQLFELAAGFVAGRRTGKWFCVDKSMASSPGMTHRCTSGPTCSTGYPVSRVTRRVNGTGSGWIRRASRQRAWRPASTRACRAPPGLQDHGRLHARAGRADCESH